MPCSFVEKQDNECKMTFSSNLAVLKKRVVESVSFGCFRILVCVIVKYTLDMMMKRCGGGRIDADISLVQVLQRRLE
jgi:hypothetical protein